MVWRITLFVADAERLPDGWRVRGEIGLGPPRVGDVFTFVHHQDVDAEHVAFKVDAIAETEVLLTGSGDVEIRTGDILGGESSAEPSGSRRVPDRHRHLPS